MIKIIKKLKRTYEFWQFQRSFSDKFIFYTTDSKSELEKIFKLRYEVFCEEFSYIDKDKHPGKKEKDNYDDKSVHFILREKQTRNLAATVRLILNSEMGFPIEKNMKIEVDILQKNRSKLAEISRLIVAKKYRKHFLLLALIKGMYTFVKEKNITHVFAVMDDNLYPILIKLGFPFKKIGPPTLYQGITTPFILDISEMEENLKNENVNLWKYLKKGLIKYNGEGNSYTIH
ncbi:MAG: GNAT family N-acyltransferase [Patescibacteria group bacterium]|nr:GNAT family N-acyltransferase [Patescibacteria group bacterium]